MLEREKLRKKKQPARSLCKSVDSRMEELLSHQTQEAGRFANRTGVLLAETEVGRGKTDSRCLELLSVFPYIERRSATSICVLLSILSGVLGGAPNKMGFCTVKSVSCRGLAEPVRTPGSYTVTDSRS